MSNIYLEKLSGDKMRGYISPAWMEHSIAKKNNKEGPKGVMANVGSHVKGTLRVMGRGLVESVAGAGVGAGAGALASLALKKDPKVGATIGAGLGQGVGSLSGTFNSLKNQEKGMHKYYFGQEKKAALASLIEHGMDYDSAIAAIEKEAGMMSMAASAARKVMAAPVVGKAVNMTIKNPMRTAVGAGALASGAGALMVRGGKEKQACVKMLMDQGVNFEQAVEMTKQASQELYGE